ncbi:hypothetical protein [Thiomicrospira sp. XS5]|uniref:hypothetical protein n=1 Tax=Thiomicrospira sp. XS5 TaxID=1775636 RepID=UPI0008381FC2|nr:hypothetical protein [Thiomicrospira sp. XS5]
MESVITTPLDRPLAVSLTFSIRLFCLVILYWYAFQDFMNNTTKKLSLLDEILSQIRRKGVRISLKRVIVIGAEDWQIFTFLKTPRPGRFIGISCMNLFK